MSWIENLGRPLCPTRRETEEFMTAELSRAVPSGWSVERVPDPKKPADVVPSLMWRVVRPGASLQDYVVLIPASGEHVIFLHGNNDAGMGSLRQFLQHARVIEAWLVRRWGVAACLTEVMSTCQPNQWGLT